MKLSKQMLRNWIDKIRFFFRENPKRAKLISFIIILAAIPITVFAALTIQNLIQLAGGGEPVQIVDANGNSISRTNDPQVYLRITLPVDWVAASNNQQFSKNNSLVEKTYAQASCPGSGKPTTTNWGGPCSYPSSELVPVSSGVCYAISCEAYTNGALCWYNGKPNEPYNDPASCPTGIATPTPSPACPGVGIPSVGWGGSCSPGTPEKALSVNSDVCSVAACQRYQQNVFCWYNSGQQYNDPKGCAAKGATEAPTLAPQRILKNLYIANNDSDGSTGGSAPLNITSNFGDYLNKPIPWNLNPLIGGQTEASRVVQVTLFDGRDFLPFIATVTLVRATQPTGTLSNIAVSFKCNLLQISRGSVCHGSALAYDSANFPIFSGITYEWGISSTNSIGSLEKTQGNITGFVAKNIGSGTIWVIARQGNRQERKGIEVNVISTGKLPSTTTGGNINDVINQFGRRGNNLSGDINRDGIVDGIDYNILLRE